MPAFYCEQRSSWLPMLIHWCQTDLLTLWGHLLVSGFTIAVNTWCEWARLGWDGWQVGILLHSLRGWNSWKTRQVSERWRESRKVAHYWENSPTEGFLESPAKYSMWRGDLLSKIRCEDNYVTSRSFHWFREEDYVTIRSFHWFFKALRIPIAHFKRR